MTRLNKKPAFKPNIGYDIARHTTKMCLEEKHELCLGHYGNKNGNFPCECKCHKKVDELLLELKEKHDKQ